MVTSRAAAAAGKTRAAAAAAAEDGSKGRGNCEMQLKVCLEAPPDEMKEDEQKSEGSTQKAIVKMT